MEHYKPFTILATLALCLSLMSFEHPRLKSSSSESGESESGGSGSYGTSLINPPNSSIDFSFNGGQVVNLTLSNSNVLGMWGSISCHTIFGGSIHRTGFLLWAQQPNDTICLEQHQSGGILRYQPYQMPLLFQ